MAPLRNFLSDSLKKVNEKIYFLLIVFECSLCIAVIRFVPYTEIDWKAYMDEVGGFLGGEYNYTLLKGSTGPLVYPAGFLYLYSFFYWMTTFGSNILLAQCIFAGLYLISIAIIWRIYQLCGLPSYYIIPLSCLSYRVHSIFMLRLFNDCICAMFCYLAVYFLCRKKSLLSALFFSLGLSVKMNALLFLPGILVVLMCFGGILSCMSYLGQTFLMQVVLAIPFLSHAPMDYLSKAFEFNRQFFFKWTVNWRFLGEPLFLDPRFQLSLLIAHAVLLIIFGWFRWKPKVLTIRDLVNPYFKGIVPDLTPSEAVKIIFQCNFIGIICSRTLHYQFYVWYYHTIPYLLYFTSLPVFGQLAIFIAIEYCWNVYPSTDFSSVLLLVCHLIILILSWKPLNLSKSKIL